MLFGMVELPQVKNFISLSNYIQCLNSVLPAAARWLTLPNANSNLRMRYIHIYNEQVNLHLNLYQWRLLWDEAHIIVAALVSVCGRKKSRTEKKKQNYAFIYQQTFNGFAILNGKLRIVDGSTENIGWMGNECTNEWAEQYKCKHTRTNCIVVRTRGQMLVLFSLPIFAPNISSYMSFGSCKHTMLKIVKHPELSAFCFCCVFSNFASILFLPCTLSISSLSHVFCRQFLCFDTVH